MSSTSQSIAEIYANSEYLDWKDFSGTPFAALDDLGRRLELEVDQISKLIIWIHPDWVTIPDDELKNGFEVIDLIKNDKRAALISLPVHKPPRDIKNLEFPSLTRRTASLECYRNSSSIVEEIELYALEHLGPRFQIWPFGRFVDLKEDPSHLEFLLKRFNIANSEKVAFIDIPKTHYFDFIACSGSWPDECLQSQIHDCGLHDIAKHVYNCGSALAYVSE